MVYTKTLAIVSNISKLVKFKPIVFKVYAKQRWETIAYFLLWERPNACGTNKELGVARIVKTEKLVLQGVQYPHWMITTTYLEVIVAILPYFSY